MAHIHQFLFVPVVLYFAVMTILGAFWFFRSSAPMGSYLPALIIGEGLIVVDAIVGALVFASGKHPHDALHWLYGGLLILALPVAYGLASQREEQDRMVVGYYALACLLIVVIAVVRSAPTGGS
jgi:heme A synthase